MCVCACVCAVDVCVLTTPRRKRLVTYLKETDRKRICVERSCNF